METITVRDGNSRLIGYIQIDEDGNKTVRDANQRLKGSYNASTNQTRDAGQKLLYQGDMSEALLTR